MGLRPTSQHDASWESALIERCRRQDPEAFAKIVDAYQNRVFGFVRRMVPDVEEAADIAQDTFIRAFQGIGRFDGRSSVRTWLFRIAHNLCVDRARRADRGPSHVRFDSPFDDEPIEVADNRWNPEGGVLDAEMHALLERAIGTMSEKLRAVLMLHDREDVAYDEIARILEIPIGTVKSRLFLARAHLQTALGPYLRGEVNQQ